MTTQLVAGEQMNVSVCNQGHLPEALVARAEVEADLIFRAMNVEIVWAKCQDEVATEDEDRGLRFIIRLRNDHPPGTVGLTSLDTMGLAFISAPGKGYMADVYYRAVEAFAEGNLTDADGLLGHVMAHELGHLLLGPGHSRQGIMHGPWEGADAMAVKRRWLMFGVGEQARIREGLRERRRR